MVWVTEVLRDKALLSDVDSPYLWSAWAAIYKQAAERQLGSK